MFSDADHEVIDSPEALFRHLYEEHGVEEARDLDPETAPLQFWLRRHAELERAQRADRRPPGQPPDPPSPTVTATTPGGAAGRAPSQPERPERRAEPAPRPQPAGAGREGRRPAGFGDPLVEAMARALAGRGHDEAAVRSAIRSFAEPGRGPAGEAAVRSGVRRADAPVGGRAPPRRPQITAPGPPAPDGAGRRRFPSPGHAASAGAPTRAAPVPGDPAGLAPGAGGTGAAGGGMGRALGRPGRHRPATRRRPRRGRRRRRRPDGRGQRRPGPPPGPAAAPLTNPPVNQTGLWTTRSPILARAGRLSPRTGRRCARRTWRG